MEFVQHNNKLANFSTGTLQNFTHEAAEFPTPLDNSYKCTPVEYIKLAGPTKAVLHLSEVQWQAFANSTDKKFSSGMFSSPFIYAL